MRRLTALTLSVLAVGLAACQGSVADPVGDAVDVEFGDVDIVEAGVDYRTDTTRLWVRYAPGEGPAEATGWQISVDGDPVAEATAVIGSRYCCAPDRDRYYVTTLSSGASRCTGYVREQGFDGEDTVSLSFDSRCLLATGYERLPDSLRIKGYTESGRQSGDETAWTGTVPRL